MSETELAEEDYIIGTNDAELKRLGLQHTLWRESGLGVWRRAGIRPGMRVLDVGCGPGYASYDLAQLVGPEGEVVAIDQSEFFLAALREGARNRGLENIRTIHAPLDTFDWPDAEFDAVWTRWVLCFLPDPYAALQGIKQALKPGGVFVAQEYVDYRSFRLEPSEPVFDRFVSAVEASWAHFKGDPNIARRFPAWFSELGLEIDEMTPVLYAARPADPIFRWPITWLEEAPARLVELGFLSRDDADAFLEFLDRRAADPDTLLMTPCVLTSRARKPG